MEENDLMALFGEGSDLELNFNTSPDDIDNEKLSTEDDISSDIDIQEQNNTPDEDHEDSEEVAGSEDQEEEGEHSDNEESNDDSPDDNLYSSFASVLIEKGLLPSLDLQDTKIENIDDLTNTFKSEISNQVKSYLINKVGEVGYEALEKGVSLSEFQQHQENINVLDNITDNTLNNDLELAKQIIMQDYISQGMDQGRAGRILKKSIDLGDDVVLEDAKESLQSLKIIQSRHLEQLAQDKEQEKIQHAKNQEKLDNDLKNSIYNEDEYFKDLKVNKNIKDRVYNSITKIVSVNPQTGHAENKLMKDRRDNPIEFDKKLYYLYELTNGFTNMKNIFNKSNSKATSNLEKHLRGNRFEDSGAPTYMDDPDSYDGPSGELVL